MKNFFKLIICLVLVEAAGIVGSIFTFQNISSWYDVLIKPELTPPSWLFGPVWAILFAMMGVSLYLIWRKGEADSGLAKPRFWVWAIILFFAQLALNILWSVLFFGRQNPGAAFLEIVVLWLAILTTIIIFAKISRPAAWLLLPYILWVSFAGYLNLRFWQLNRLVPENIACTKEAKTCPDGSVVGRVAPKCDFANCPVGS